MRRSLERRGQLTAVVVFEEGDKLELVDGFKRYRAAKQLDWTRLWVRVLSVGSAAPRQREFPLET
jgi:ParB-like chromosome segregation protein Spo0J